jgi:DNA-binding beta-propeller fold protein YncE
MTPRVGEGRYRFELVPDWPRVPEGFVIGQTGIACDSQDRVYLFNRSDHPVLVFDRDGELLSHWGEGRYTSAHHLAIDKADRLYLPIWAAHVVVQCDTDGNELMSLGNWNVPSDPRFDSPDWLSLAKQVVPRPLPPFTLPTDVTVDSDGSILVTDGYGNARVHRFDRSGKLIASWGEPGSKPGQFFLPHSIKLLSDGRVLVADRENHRVQVFDPDGRFIDEWLGFSNPCHLYVDEHDSVFVAEGTGFSKSKPGSFLQIRDRNGRAIGGWQAPFDAGGHGVWMDSRGDLYVGQNKEGQRILKYRRC